jgi:nicotinamidase-related amidase
MGIASIAGKDWNKRDSSWLVRNQRAARQRENEIGQQGSDIMYRTKWLLAFGLIAAVGLGASRLRAATIIDDWASIKPPPAPELKSVTVEPKTTALLMLDFVNLTCNARVIPRCLATLPAVKKLLAAARAKDMLVIYTAFGKLTEHDIVPDVAPTGKEPFFVSFIDKFMGTDLEKTLKDKGIQTVIAVGLQARGVILSTSSTAALRGFKVVVPVDGMSDDLAYAEQYTAWDLIHAPVIASHITLTAIDMLKF